MTPPPGSECNCPAMGMPFSTRPTTRRRSACSETNCGCAEVPRSKKRLGLRIHLAGLDSAKTLEGFDFNFNVTINRQQVLDLATSNYMLQKRNVLVRGPTGVGTPALGASPGETHLAQALAHEAGRRGYDVIFINTHRLLQHLNAGHTDSTFERRLQGYVRADLLVQDEVGLKPLRQPGPEDLYDLIKELYERGSILLTSNRAPFEWPDLFGDPLLASAGLDRLADKAHTLVITGASFRVQSRDLAPQEEPSDPWRQSPMHPSICRSRARSPAAVRGSRMDHSDRLSMDQSRTVVDTLATKTSWQGSGRLQVGRAAVTAGRIRWSGSCR